MYVKFNQALLIPLHSSSDKLQKDFFFTFLDGYSFLRHETNIFESRTSNDPLGEPEGISEKFLVVVSTKLFISLDGFA